MNRSKNRCALKPICVAWQFINWDKVKHAVHSLQQRIVKALKAGRHNKVKALQWLLTHSLSAKLLAVKRVTENKGKRTPGTDKVIWEEDQQKRQAAMLLKRKGYKAKPLRRIYIPKKNGKKRPLGIPTMHDRAMQALYLLALEPISETTADVNSYGFRPYRGCADAIGQCFNCLSRKQSVSWILEADIEGCFDHIDHQWILNHIPLDRQIVETWLKSGFIDKGNLFSTHEGTPQGGIVSPTLANMTLDGLGNVIRDAVNKKAADYGNPIWKIRKVHFVRYADDFVVIANSKELLEDVVKPAIIQFLSSRGLKLSEQKTRLTHINEGFDFLGQNIRKYNNGKVLTKPSKQSIKSINAKVKEIISKNKASSAQSLIYQLNPVIRGWGYYHRHVCSKNIYAKIDHYIWQCLWQWSIRRHPGKGLRWIKDKYFKTIDNRHWVFSGLFQDNIPVYLEKMSDISIKRHVKIKANANPFDVLWKEYFLTRSNRKEMDTSYEELSSLV